MEPIQNTSSERVSPIAQYIQKIIHFFGSIAAYSTIALVGLITLDVATRYIFNITYNWVIELEWHLFGIIFLLGAAYTLQQDKHVRVDLFYSQWSRKRQIWIDLFGTLFLLIPWCVLSIRTAYHYAINAWYMKEGSPNPNGIPAWYPIKFAIVLGFVLLLLQGILMIFQYLKRHGN